MQMNKILVNKRPVFNFYRTLFGIYTIKNLLYEATSLDKNLLTTKEYKCV